MLIIVVIKTNCFKNISVILNMAKVKSEQIEILIKELKKELFVECVQNPKYKARNESIMALNRMGKILNMTRECMSHFS